MVVGIDPGFLEGGPDHGSPVSLVGKDATLFHYSRTDDTDSDDGEYIDEAQRWFDTIWTTIGRDLTP